MPEVSVLDISSSSGAIKGSRIGVLMRSMCDRDEDERTRVPDNEA
jgi:hypothetical protein